MLSTHHQNQILSYFRQHKSKWTSEEDRKLTAAVEQFGTDSWIKISQHVPGRNSKQCRERWMGQLAPSIKKSSWTAEEDQILIKQHSVIGNKWTTIAMMLPGRSAINIKNRWSRLKRLPCANDQDGVSKKIQPKSTLNNDGYNFTSAKLSSDYDRSSADDSYMNINERKYPRNINQSSSSSAENIYDVIMGLKGNQSPVIFDFSMVDLSPFFGEDFARFQVKMLE
ncbi:DNA-binding protein eta2 [Tritrichomonas foetus]|uniref:DNA-binding protein eta2 n=1 Tax=Tritrichomonas foetus TaxID=1144522 RepID=A0A1J4KGU4_9EUKA|nr:DNA-binding protein eta2 [Tritrichomonas foetus]|eukprot:OHT10435.1 DNA-binding protein eta2 [Tritrichomonas foetus]